MPRAKTVVPHAPAQLVDRPALRGVLDARSSGGEQGPVVLVSAPAGYGKTATVAGWVRARDDVDTAWVTLDTADREEASFWSSVLAALHACPGPHRPVPDPADAAALRALVVEALDELPAPVCLVLDDVHEILGHPAVEGLRALVRHPLRRLVLVLCTRVDPPLGLDRLRLDGRLGELRAADLRFSTDEAAALLDLERIDLPPDRVATLVARTEGWPAALRLAALSLRTAPDPTAFVRDFAGDDRSVADYLVDEVLTRLSEREYRVLVATSVRRVVAVDAAVALTDDPGAGDVLAELAAGGGMLTPLDRHGRLFHTHELLRSHILTRLRRRDPEHLAELHRRASAWCEEDGDPVGALEHSTAAGDRSATAALLRRRTADLLARGEFEVLNGTLGTWPAEPRLDLLRAVVDLETGRLDAADRALRTAGASGDETLRRVVEARRAAVHGRPAEGVAAARGIDPDAIPGAALRGIAHATRGTALATVDPARARRECERALEIADRHGFPYLALQAESTLGIARTSEGDPVAMTRSAHAVVERAARHGWVESPWAIAALAILAAADLRRARPARAREHATRALQADAARFPALLLLVSTVLGAAEHDLGDTLDGWRRIRHARMSGDPSALDEHLLALTALHEQETALALGHAAEAHEAVRAVAHRLAGSPDLAFLEARGAWVTARDPGARRLLAPALDDARPPVLLPVLVEAPLLDAEIALTRGERATARRRVRTALERADRLGVTRPLHHLAPPVRLLLAEHAGSFGRVDALVREALALPAAAAAPEPTALTDRERAVLEMLPTQRTAVEIADDLAVSVNTVKTHVRAIYAKLQVDSRRHAVTEARRRGLFDVAR
ncbi:LuxR C-terminal-related transcriptional regulator [Actinomycetospora flava]|uniref:LuxR C-terminal-related transcriptional regulator n=1 Tax=Actinomycetospora flava TaxID=3129232 RepID=A0ABU8M9G2_9PSEU